jgi:hypothetical protein
MFVAAAPVSGISLIAPPVGELLSEKLLDDSYPATHQTFPYISWLGLRAA